MNSSNQLTAPAPPQKQASPPAPTLEYAVTAAADRERRRLARMLHDTICQSVTGVNLLARLLSRRVKEKAPDLEPDLLELTDLLRVSMIEVQDTVRALAGPQAGGLASALAELARVTSDQVPCELVCPDELPRPAAGMTGQLLRIVQEAVDNAVLHSRATRLKIVVRHEESGELAVSVLDNGQGFNPALPLPERISGLELMRYRAATMGGTLSVESQPGQGTTLTCHLPSRS